MSKKKKKKIVRTAVLAVLVVAIAIIVFFQKTDQSDTKLREEILSTGYITQEAEDIPSYEAYYAENKEKYGGKEVKSEVIVSGMNYIKQEGLSESLQEIEGGVLTGEKGSISYEVEVPESGAYAIELKYLPIADGTATIIRNLYINGKLPFAEAEGISFERLWTDENKDFLMQTNKNQAVPDQVQKSIWAEKKIESAQKNVAGAFAFYLEQGKNTITFVSESESMGIASFKLIPYKELPTYEEYRLENKGEIITNEKLSGETFMVQAEDTYVKSSSMLTPVNNRTSPKTIPYHPSNIILNAVGGDTWTKTGSGMTWKITVPMAGFYKIAVRFEQSSNRDFYSIRELKINGEVPFSEAANLKFYYDSGFQYNYLGNEKNEAYYFYLQEGENELSFAVSLGDLAEAMKQASISVKNFNMLYRRLTSVMGSSPDPYRDYKILTSVPDLTDILKTEYCRLYSVMESLGDTLTNSTKTREISKLLYQMEHIIKKPDLISKELKTFNDNITALGEWTMTLGDQPLLLDYILVCGDGYKLPKPNGSFFDRAAHTVKAFFGSFTNDYSITNEEQKKDKKVEVWIATSTRDQFDIAQRMVNNELKDKDYQVVLKMVGADSVMPATLTGNGPDVAIQLNYSMPVNFAYRSAGYDLTQFDDFEEVAAEFSDAAMEYFKYNDGYYALPDQMSFPVMYYRKDILEELGLKVPETWDELTALLPYLKAKNMSAWFLTTGHTTLGGASSSSAKPVNSIFLSMLYQNGQELYRKNGAEVNLDELDSLLTFKHWTEFYTMQGFELSINAVTRFRTGETPIIIEDYTLQNSITVAAPEIDGAWAIAPIPGTKRADGTIDRSVSCMVGASMILRNIVEERGTANEAWDFLKWWTSKKTQLNYANSQKVIYGDSAIFPLSNIEALRETAKEEERLSFLNDMIPWLHGTEQVPGSYITGRSIENAFLSVFYNNLNPVDTLYTQIRLINAELKNKREEFGIID